MIYRNKYSKDYIKDFQITMKLSILMKWRDLILNNYIKENKIKAIHCLMKKNRKNNKKEKIRKNKNYLIKFY